MSDDDNFPVDDEAESRRVVSGREEILDAALEVAKIANRELVIYSNQLAGELFASPNFIEVVRQLAIASQHTEVRILVRNSSAAIRNAPQLLDLCKTLSSMIKIRSVAPVHRDRQVTFIVADDRAVIYHPSPDSNEAVFDEAPATAKHYLNAFQAMWNAGRTEPDFRALRI